MCIDKFSDFSFVCLRRFKLYALMLFSLLHQVSILIVPILIVEDFTTGKPYKELLLWDERIAVGRELHMLCRLVRFRNRYILMCEVTMMYKLHNSILSNLNIYLTEKINQ